MTAHTMITRRMRAGIGFRSPHFNDIVASRPAVGWFEVHAENYMGGGPALRQIEQLRGDWPLSLHGVGLSLGGADGLDGRHLERLAALVDRIEPILVSEHLAWSTFDGAYLNDLLPLPYTEESLGIVTTNVLRLQDRLRRRVLIENPSVYVRFAHATLDEAAFLDELVRRTGCGILCDVNNIHVSCHNVGGDAACWLEALPPEAVGEIHLAGHCVVDADGTTLLIDDHGSRVTDPVWELYRRAVRRFPDAPALIEWDSDLPALDVLVSEAATADVRRHDVLAESPNDIAA